jgi:hypothetical protein
MRYSLPALLFSLFPVAAWAAPVAAADAASTPGKTPVTLAVTANDTGSPSAATVDFNTAATGTRLTTRTVSGQGTFVADDAGNVTFTPLATFSGTCATTYFVRDAGGAASNFATIRVTVGPVANDDLVLVTYQTARTFQPTANDVVASGAAFDFSSLDLDPGQPDVQAQRTLAAGTLTADNAGNVTFQPAAGFAGSVPDVPYTVADTRSPAQPSNVGTIRLRVGGRPFDCTGEFFQLSQIGSTARLFRLTRNSAGGTVNYAANALYDTGTQLNALALSGADGYLYAIGIGTGNTGQVYQLSQDGAVSLGLIPGLPANAYNSATADDQGNYYLANNTTSTIYRASLRTFTATPVALSQAVQCGDIAFNPADGFLYASRYPNDLYRINLASANATKPATTLSAATSGGNMGSIFFDASGTLYGATNDGTFYVYDLGSGLSTAIGTANTSTQGDGASCAFPGQKIDVVKATGTVVKRSATVFDVPVTIRVRNTSSAEAPNVQVNEFLYAAGNSAVTFAGASSVAIVAGPTAGGDLPAASTNPLFSGQGSNTGLLLGNQSLQAGQTGTLTFTARVAYPAGAVPGQAFNTAYASTAAATPNAGYQQLASGTLVSPDQVLAADRSTNGSTLPASANADAPAPSPINLGGARPLPVTLRAFTAVAEGPAARLAWATASEVNSAYFAVERAAEGEEFTELGRVAGQGTSTVGATYAYRDAGAARAGATVYYRLRQVDADGTATYSPVRGLRFGAAAVALYPTPAGATATLDLTALPASPQAVVVLDLAGRTLARYSLAGGQTHPLDLRGLPVGVSLVRVAGYTLRLLHQE